MKKTRLAIINTHPIQYFAPLYKFLNENTDLDITVIYLSDENVQLSYSSEFNKQMKWNINLLEGYKYKFVGKNYQKKKIGNFFSIIAPELFFEISRKKYDVVWIHGYNFASLVIATLAAKLKNIPILFRSETHNFLKRTYINKKIHYLLIKNYLKLFNCFLAIGKANADYYISMNISKKRIFMVPYTIDNNRFFLESIIKNDSKILIKKNTYKICDDRLIFLFASKFINRKHPELILYATNELIKENKKFSVIFAGDGPMFDELQQIKNKFNLNNVHFVGLVNQLELPKIYGLSDVFLLPSENEPWGVVVNEAMSAGLAIIAGHEIGSAFDLVKDNVNGYNISTESYIELKNAMNQMIIDRDKVLKMKKESINIINQWNFESCKKGLLNSINYLKNK